MSHTPWDKISDYLKDTQKGIDAELQQWLSEDEANIAILNDIQKYYTITGVIPSPISVSKTRAWKRIIRRIDSKGASSSHGSFFLKIAASILLFASGGGITYLILNKHEKLDYTEIHSPGGNKTRVVLPDKSIVWLNGNSSVRYASDFTKHRNVELTGEGYFEVTHDKSSLFTIQSGKVKLEVYGTIFDFKAYPDENVAEVALIKGSVGVVLNNQPVKRLTPGEAVSINHTTSSISTSYPNLNQVTAWKSDELIIKDMSLTETARYLERWYGVNISLDNSLKQGHLLNFNVKTESLREILSIMDRIVPISYEINGKEVKIERRNKFK